LPVFLSLTTIVPEELSLDTISTSGLAATDNLTAASTGFFFINSGSRPASLALWTMKNPTAAAATITRTTSPAKMPTIHRMILPAPPDAGGAAGGPPAGGCGLADGDDDMEVSFMSREVCATVSTL